MARENLPATVSSATDVASTSKETDSQLQPGFDRRSLLKGLGVVGVAVSAGSLLTPEADAEPRHGGLPHGDAAILRFLAAAEILESDLWLQYTELAGTQDDEVAKIASQQISGYPATATGGNNLYTQAVLQLDSDMDQYIHDNTEDELTHETFINAYLVSKGAAPVNLEQFRTLPSSKATGANQVGRLTNLMQLTVDTSWWTRYRSRTGNPDFGDTFANAVPTLGVNQHPAIPRTDDDLTDSNFLQAIANTAGFHFAFIEQGGTSLYPKLAQRVTSVDVLRIVLAIGGTEIAHFQTWHDKAGNAIPSPNGVPIIDPVTKVPVLFPDLTNAAVPPVGEDLQSNLIMPEPTVFIKGLPACSIIRPTATKGAAAGAVASLAADGLFIGQSSAFFEFMNGLAADADNAKRGIS